ncbi:MAG: hypothetical protein ACRC2T_08790 [Thermoguttaceae bacterium]
MKQIIFFSVILISCIFSLGCSNKVGLKGKVVFSDTKEPLPCGEIQFSNDTLLARGTIKEDGTFIMGTDKKKDGLPPGTYGVAISRAVVKNEEPIPIGPNGFPLGPEEFDLIHPKYKNRATSEITVNVDKNTRIIEIEVDRP